MDLRDDELEFLDDDAGAPPLPAHEGWRILIVDDDDGMHVATQLAFNGFLFAGRPVHFESAYSGAEARRRLASDPPYACVLLDVVMETDHAGLDTVRYIRRGLGDDLLRIILRTGQPGTAPEISVVQDYDINDYREKGRTTTEHLRTSVTAALRSYQQLQTIQENRRGLEMVIAASASLLSQQNLADFASGILTQIAALLHVRPEGIVCVSARRSA
jgi:CheY-like chemotaxis protein